MMYILGNLCINVFLWSKSENQFKKADAIFDTGAHTTHIDTTVLQNLGYDVKNADKTYVSTVGNSNMPVGNTVIDNIKIGGCEIGSAIVNFSNMETLASIVIGLNIIKEFKVTLDFQNMKILLEPNFDINSKIAPEDFSKNSSRFGVWTIGG